MCGCFSGCNVQRSLCAHRGGLLPLRFGVLIRIELEEPTGHITQIVHCGLTAVVPHLRGQDLLIAEVTNLVGVHFRGGCLAARGTEGQADAVATVTKAIGCRTFAGGRGTSAGVGGSHGVICLGTLHCHNDHTNPFLENGNSLPNG